jgi:phosphopantetheine adenylyltransferase
MSECFEIAIPDCNDNPQKVELLCKVCKKYEKCFEIRLFHGKYKVHILKRLNGHYLVEALEDFSDIKKGQQFTTRNTNLWNIVKEPEP